MAEPPRKPSSGALPAVPDLVVAPRPSQQMRAVRPTAPAPPPPPPAVTFDDGDDFDMHIERNLGTADLPTATSSRAPMIAPSSMRSGLELDGSRRGARTYDDTDDAPSIGMRIAGAAVGLGVLGGTAFALVRYAHRPAGMKIAALLPRAFDGSSAAESAVVAFVALILAVAFGFIGVKTTPRSWALVGSAAATLFLSLAMVTVALASSGENGAPPDGALLVPWLAPLAIAGVALALAGRAGSLFADRSLGKKLAAVPVAAVGGFVMYVAYETSKLGTG